MTRDEEMEQLRAELAAVREENQMLRSRMDVDREMRVEAELRELALRHKLSLEASKIGIWDWNVQTDELVWDETMHRLYGMRGDSEAQSAYDTWMQGVHPDDRAENDSLVSRALAGEADFDTTFRVCHPDGAIHILRAKSVVIRDEDGNAIRMLGVNWDITEERRKAEDLRQTAIGLKAANEELRQFAYFLSHDLRAPLRHISAFVELIDERLKGANDEEVRQWMRFVIEGAARMRRMINDLLAYARVDQSSPPEESAIALGEVLEAVKRTALSADDRAELHYDELPIVVGGRTHMEQLFQNLVENAIGYCEEGVKPSIDIKAERAGAFWNIDVKDNGEGIRPEHLSKIFQPFFSTAHNQESSGIGLAVCRKIVDRYGGCITAESAPGQGTTFRIVLRAAEG